MLTDKLPKVYLSERNLRTLLAKLEFEKTGGETGCCIIKERANDPQYRQTMQTIAVFAVQDEEYYCAQNRPATEVHPREEVKLYKPSTGTVFPFDPFEPFG